MRIIYTAIARITVDCDRRFRGSRFVFLRMFLAAAFGERSNILTAASILKF